MPAPTIPKAVAALTAVALLVAGCGGASSDDTVSSSSATPTSTGAPALTDQQSPPERLVVDVTISGGQVTPTNEQLQTTVGVPIILRVDSDAADQLHVHATPEHTFDIEPGTNQSFQFTVDVPGKVDVELHELNRTIVVLQ